MATKPSHEITLHDKLSAKTELGLTAFMPTPDPRRAGDAR